jgi:hypothetical protein
MACGPRRPNHYGVDDPHRDPTRARPHDRRGKPQHARNSLDDSDAREFHGTDDAIFKIRCSLILVAIRPARTGSAAQRRCAARDRCTPGGGRFPKAERPARSELERRARRSSRAPSLLAVDAALPARIDAARPGRSGDRPGVADSAAMECNRNVSRLRSRGERGIHHDSPNSISRAGAEEGVDTHPRSTLRHRVRAVAVGSSLRRRTHTQVRDPASSDTSRSAEAAPPRPREPRSSS